MVEAFAKLLEDSPIIPPSVVVVKSPNCGSRKLPIPFTRRLKIHLLITPNRPHVKVRLAREDVGEVCSKVVDPADLYARVDPAKKRKRDSATSSTSPDSDPRSLSSPMGALSPDPLALSPTRALIQRFNEGQQRGGLNEQEEEEEEEGEVVYEEVGPRRPPVPLPRTRGGVGGGATSPDM